MFRYGILKSAQNAHVVSGAQAASGAQAIPGAGAVHPHPDSETPPHQLP